MLIESPLSDVFDHRLLKTLGVNEQVLPEIVFDEHLKLFVSQFIKAAKDNGRDISQETQDRLREIKYVDALSIGPAPGVMAVCNRYFAMQETLLGGPKKIHWMVIEVLKSTLDTYTTDDPKKAQILLREVIFHELFHCFMAKGHLPDSTPGIMNAFFVKGDTRAVKEWDQLVTEMFSDKEMALCPDTSG